MHGIASAIGARLALVTIAGVLLLAACGGSDVGSSATTQSSVASPPAPVLETVDEPLATAGSTLDGQGVPNDYVAEIVADAAKRANAPIADLVVEMAEEVQWSDGSLGCPEPGVAYTQAMVDGFQVVVETPDGTLDYRTSGTDFFVVCDRG